MYTKIWNDEIKEKLVRRLQIEQAKGNAVEIRECEEAIEGQYCPDCSPYDDAPEGEDGDKCPMCGRICETD